MKTTLLILSLLFALTKSASAAEMAKTINVKVGDGALSCHTVRHHLTYGSDNDGANYSENTLTLDLGEDTSTGIKELRSLGEPGDCKAVQELLASAQKLPDGLVSAELKISHLENNFDSCERFLHEEITLTFSNKLILTGTGNKSLGRPPGVGSDTCPQ